MVAGGKASSDSITELAWYVMFSLAHEASKRQTVVVGGMVRPLAVKASGGGIPATGDSPVPAKAGQASGGRTIKMTRGLYFLCMNLHPCCMPSHKISIMTLSSFTFLTARF